MVENKTRKIERDEIVVCNACNSAIPKEFLKKSVGGIKNLYCQYCGVSLNLTQDSIDNNVSCERPIISSDTSKESSLTNINENNKKNDFALSYSNLRNVLRDYMFQLIYQLLTSTPLTLKKIQNKKELKTSHINTILKKLWNELKDLNRNDLATQELVSSRRRINNYFEKFQSALRPYKQFRKNNFTIFAENIEFVFGLILGDYEFSNLTTSKKRIVLDLKKSFGFKSDTATTNSFTYNISLIISKKIRNILSQYHITEGNDNKIALDEIIDYIIDYIVNKKVKSSDLSEFNSSEKKKFYNTLEILIKNLTTDWIYRKSFEDHIYKLILIVNSLISDADYSSSLNGLGRLISQGLKQSALFEKDLDFSPHFKLNLTLILCRIIFLKIKKSPELAKINSESIKLSLMDENLIQNSIIDDITAGQKINTQLLKTFYKLFLEEFQTYYEKLQQKLASDLIYIDSFRDYISDLVKLVFNIVNSISKKSHLTKLELAVIKDLANYNFEWFYKKPERTYFYYVNSANHSKEYPDEEIEQNVQKGGKTGSPPTNLLKYVRAYKNIVEQLKNDHREEIIYEKMLAHSKVVVTEYILENFKLLDTSSSKKLSEDLTNWIGLKANMVRRGDPNFNQICLKPSIYGFKYGIYQMVFNLALSAYHELPYIGYSKDFDSRMLSHISQALEANAKNQLARYIDKAIIRAIEEEFFIVKNKIEEIDEFAIIENIRDIYFWMITWRRSKDIKNFIYNVVIKKHFSVTILEYHKGRSNALVREKELTKTMIHYIKGDKEVGTIFPYGLNKVAGGAGGSEVDYDFHLFDYVALTSLGIKHEEIVRILNEVYNERIPTSSLSEAVKNEFGVNSRELQIQFLKPVVERLLKDSEDFSLKDIAVTVNMDVSTLGSKLSLWFNGNNYFDLKALSKAGILDWDRITEYSTKTQKALRGRSISEWKTWLMDNRITMDEIASKFDLTKASLYKKANIRRLSKFLIGSELESMKTLRKEIKKQITKELLGNDVDPKAIMENFFHIKYISNQQLTRSFGDLFSDEGYDFKTMIETFSSNSGRFIDLYRL